MFIDGQVLIRRLLAVVLVVASGLFLTGCLLTRSQVKEKDQRVELQTKAAEKEANYVDMEETLRVLRGRVEELENEKNLRQQEEQQSHLNQQAQSQHMDEKFKLFQQALTSLEQQIQSLSAQVADLKKKDSSKVKSAQKSNKGIFEKADDQFSQKNWKEAIIQFQKYRDKYPNGRRYRQATYKIGVSFHELGLKSEAKSFYKEVVNKFPKTKTANLARKKLKAIE